MQRRKLRIGLLMNGMELAAWSYRMVELIRQSNYAEISLIVQNTPPAVEQQASLGDRVASKLRSEQFWAATFRRLLTTAEQWLVGKPGRLADSSTIVDCGSLLGGIEVIQVHPRRGRFSDYIEGDELASIQARDIDVFIRLGFRILRGGILRSARYGVWSYHHGDNTVNRGGPPGFWEVMESWPVTGSVLQVLTEDLDNGNVLYRSFSSTQDMSLTDNASNFYWKALHFIPRRLRELHDDGAEAFFARLERHGAGPRFYDRRLYTEPTNGELCRLLWKKLLQKIRRRIDRQFYFDQWCLLFDIRQGLSTSLWRFKKIVPPKDRFWADPFVIARGGKYHIFIEEFMYSTRKGHISLVVMDRNGTFEPPLPVLETPYHLSYPFVFEYDGGTYMIPESMANHTVELYKCVDFPRKWVFQKNLIENCNAVDSTLFQWQGKWWLFANQRETVGASTWEELFLYHSDSPLSGNWTPHARNPIVSDVRSSRPAGRLFVDNGRIYRPSQDCSRRYGYGFNLCEITKLTESEYEEIVVSKVEPKWDKNIISTHTINYDDGLTIIDGELRRRK